MYKYAENVLHAHNGLSITVTPEQRNEEIKQTLGSILYLRR